MRYSAFLVHSSKMPLCINISEFVYVFPGLGFIHQYQYLVPVAPVPVVACVKARNGCQPFDCPHREITDYTTFCSLKEQIHLSS
jgi:hypothetical protein